MPKDNENGYICMVVDGNYPNDIRVRKEAESLAEKGKKILVICPAKKELPKQETINGVLVYRIGDNYSFTKKGIYDIVESITDINLFFYFGLKKVFRKFAIDYLHIHDLPIAGTGYLFKEEVKKGLILDLHENFPEALKTWFAWRKSSIVKLKNALFFNPKQWSKKEKKYCEKYDKIICVVEEMKAKLAHNFQVDSSKMLVISNHEKIDFVENFENNKIQNCIDPERFSITYVGGFGPHRGLDTAIKGMKLVSENIPEAKMYLIGKGSKDVQNTLVGLIESNKLQNHVEIVGYRPFKEVAAIMQASNINMIPHNADEHTNNTIPHKLFQIMLSKSLLLVSSCKPLKRIVGTYDAGVVFEAGNSLDFSHKVHEIHSNIEEYQQKIQNAFDAVTKKGENWESESEKLLDLYNNWQI